MTVRHREIDCRADIHRVDGRLGDTAVATA